MINNVFVRTSFFIYVLIGSLLGMHEVKNPFFNQKEEAFFALKDCLFTRAIPEQHLVVIIKRLKHDVIMAPENSYVQVSVAWASLDPIADFLNLCWYWAVVKKMGLEKEKIALLTAEQAGALDEAASKNFHTKRSCLYKALSHEEINALHRKTVLEGIDQLLALLNNYSELVVDSTN